MHPGANVYPLSFLTMAFQPGCDATQCVHESLLKRTKSRGAWLIFLTSDGVLAARDLFFMIYFETLKCAL